MTPFLALFLPFLVFSASSPKPWVANPFACKKCHVPQFEFWEGTKHSSAYLVLFAKNQHFDPGCIECHSLGFRESTGFTRIAEPVKLTQKDQGEIPWVERLMGKVFEGQARTPLDSRKEPDRYQKLHQRYHEELRKSFEQKEWTQLYIGVQCEHCHGNRAQHLAQGKRGPKVELQRCLGCHQAPNAKPVGMQELASQACPKIKRKK